MKPNKLTPGHNLRWESSRMMLPEHKEVIQRHQRELNKKTKPILDDQQIAVISKTINDAIIQEVEIKIQIFHPYHEKFITGKIKKLAIERNQIKLHSRNAIKWINFDEILDAFPLKDEYE